MGRPDGVTVAICCHNSSRFLPETLRFLQRQSVSSQVPWEVLIVDNNSTDGTAELARSSWSNASVPLRVVDEVRLGVAYARERAFTGAKYEVVTFLDDDNHPAIDWVQRVWDIMANHPEVGACGGRALAKCETTPPWWFGRYATSYAVGSVQAHDGDVAATGGFLWGAGLTVRRAAWKELVARGFRPNLVGRSGRALLSGDDKELCLGLKICGWRLRYDSRLTLHHFVPEERLRFRYLRGLQRGFGASTIALDAYASERSGRLKAVWQWQLLLSLVKIALHSLALVPTLVKGLEGNHRLLRWDASVGRLGSLMKARRSYGDNIARVHSLDTALRPTESTAFDEDGEWLEAALEESC